MRRDIGRIQDALVRSGRAQWFTESSLSRAAEHVRTAAQVPEAGGDSVAKAELRRTAEAVRRLVIPH